MLTIYLARHATPDRTRTDLAYHLLPGPDLTETGLVEARALGEFLKGAGVTRLFTSPLERCLHTARIAAEVTGAPVETISSLVEWQPGEDQEAIYHRFWPPFNEMVQIGLAHGPVAAVTHGGPVGVLLSALGMDSTTLGLWRIFDGSNPLPPAGAWRAIQREPGGPWELALAFRPSAGRAVSYPAKT